MKRISLIWFTHLLLIAMLFGCKSNSTTPETQSLQEEALQQLEDVICKSLIDDRDVQIRDISVAFSHPEVVVLACNVTAYNQFGGRSRNPFEVVFLKDGRIRVENNSKSSTTFSRARVLAKAPYNSQEYKEQVAYEIIDLLSF